MKPISILIILLFTFALAACGGGGSSGSAPVMPTDPTDPTEPTTHDIDMSSLLEGYMTVPAGEYMIDAGAMMDVGHATFSCPADGDACTVTVNDNGTATSTGGMATAMPSQMARNDMMRDQNAASKAAAERIAGLIGPGVDTADANSSTGDQGLSIVTLSTPPSDDNFSMPQFQTTDGTTPASVEFMHSADDPAMISGWTGGTYTHTSEDGNTMHTVVKYNDKAADKDTKYSTFFSVANAGSATHRAGTAVTSVSAFDGTTPGVLDLDEGDIAGNHGLFTGNFGPTTEGMYTFPGVAKVTGTFRGVPGTFNCATDCISTHDKDGNLSDLTGDWTFEPDGLRDAQGAFLQDDSAATPPTTALTDALAAIMVPGVMQDPDYMIFGYWVQSMTDAEGDTTETMLPFADGKRDYGAVGAARSGGQVVGTATYTGPATGLYMKKTITPQGGVDPSGPYASGQFTADAMLEASFGGDNVAVNDQFSISGTISNFMDGDTAIDSDWMVNLRRGINDQGNTDPTDDLPAKNIGGGTGATGTFSGVTHGGMLDDASNEGAWSGTFHGDPAADQPTSASGIFDAHFTNGHVRGAFATNIVEDE